MSILAEVARMTGERAGRREEAIRDELLRRRDRIQAQLQSGGLPETSAAMLKQDLAEINRRLSLTQGLGDLENEMMNAPLARSEGPSFDSIIGGMEKSNWNFAPTPASPVSTPAPRPTVPAPTQMAPTPQSQPNLFEDDYEMGIERTAIITDPDMTPSEKLQRLQELDRMKEAIAAAGRGKPAAPVAPENFQSGYHNTFASNHRGGGLPHAPGYSGAGLLGGQQLPAAPPVEAPPAIPPEVQRLYDHLMGRANDVYTTASHADTGKVKGVSYDNTDEHLKVAKAIRDAGLAGDPRLKMPTIIGEGGVEGRRNITPEASTASRAARDRRREVEADRRELITNDARQERAQRRVRLEGDPREYMLRNIGFGMGTGGGDGGNDLLGLSIAFPGAAKLMAENNAAQGANRAAMTAAIADIMGAQGQMERGQSEADARDKYFGGEERRQKGSTFAIVAADAMGTTPPSQWPTNPAEVRARIDGSIKGSSLTDAEKDELTAIIVAKAVQAKSEPKQDTLVDWFSGLFSTEPYDRGTDSGQRRRSRHR